MIRRAECAGEASLVSKVSKATLAGILAVSLVPTTAIANEKPVDATATNTESTGQSGLENEASSY
jgi:hypothetical protein